MSSSNGWYWYDKEPYLYTNWQPGQPSTENVCAVASLDTENSQWRVEDCLFTHGVACKVPKRQSICLLKAKLFKNRNCILALTHGLILYVNDTIFFIIFKVMSVILE